MAEDVNPTLIRQTKETLSKYIKKPPLHEKFLKKPPFRFLHDIVKSVVKETNFLSHAFSADQLDSDKIKDRDSKVKFLDKLIAEVQAATGKTISARPSKIVAGLEADKTLELLILVGEAIKQTADNTNATSKTNSDKKSNEEKKIPKTKEKTEKERKTTSKTIQDSGHKDLKKSLSEEQKPVPKNAHRIENKESKKFSAGSRSWAKTKEEVDIKDKKNLLEKKKETEKPAKKTKEEILLNKDSKDSLKSENKQVDSLLQDEINKSTTLENDKNDEKKRNKEVENKLPSNQNEPESPSKRTTSDSNTIGNMTTETKKLEKANESPKKTNTLQDVKTKPNEKLEKNVQPKPNKNVKTVKDASLKESNTIKNISNVLGKTIPEAKERTISANVRKRELNQQNEPPSIKENRAMRLSVNKKAFTPELGFKSIDEASNPVNIFSDNLDDKDDNMFIPETQYILPSNNQVVDNTGEFHEQGQLVSQILDTKKQLESTENETRTRIDWEESANWRKSSGEKEVGAVKQLIQQVTKNVGPLGHLLASLQEDVDEMTHELSTWRQINSELSVKIQKEKELTSNLLKPLMKQLKELEEVEYIEEVERVTAAKLAVYNNDKKIVQLLNSKKK